MSCIYLDGVSLALSISIVLSMLIAYFIQNVLYIKSQKKIEKLEFMIKYYKARLNEYDLKKDYRK